MYWNETHFLIASLNCKLAFSWADRGTYGVALIILKNTTSPNFEKYNCSFPAFICMLFNCIFCSKIPLLKSEILMWNVQLSNLVLILPAQNSNDWQNPSRAARNIPITSQKLNSSCSRLARSTMAIWRTFFSGYINLSNSLLACGQGRDDALMHETKITGKPNMFLTLKRPINVTFESSWYSLCIENLLYLWNHWLGIYSDECFINNKIFF